MEMIKRACQGHVPNSHLTTDGIFDREPLFKNKHHGECVTADLSCQLPIDPIDMRESVSKPLAASNAKQEE